MYLLLCYKTCLNQFENNKVLKNSPNPITKLIIHNDFFFRVKRLK